jgi:chromosome segregation ATPase
MAKATASNREKCLICQKEKTSYKCNGCSRDFCFDHLVEHRQTINQLFDGIENDRDQFHQTLTERKQLPRNLPLIEKVNKWEEDSIKKIKETAEECRQIVIKHSNKHFIEIEEMLSELTEHLKQVRKENEFNEVDLNTLKIKLTKLAEEFDEPSNIKIEYDSGLFINKISILFSPGKHDSKIWNHRKL